ncbi:DUF4249 domain-containing protein [Pontibacter qinzhouensis]|uniref:DUF4249 domain-containing protein n=1 Tax=Pontibacter qinzhouensis TaxID=2603253 RepID=A0A5C8KBF9_9BACT|nr:DUF4249 domain-containing protein [Pontibacter qinzhouensis]TXK49095.1 DUF4249 domain-containing protein [Pontibacter qinzhouensis]
MKLPNTLYLLLLLPLLAGCNLQKDIDVVLPPHKPVLVVEGYLEYGRPLRITVLESSSYFDEPEVPLVPDAKAFITYKGRRIALRYQPHADPVYNKYYTHRSDEIMTGQPGDMYTLDVSDNQGRKVTATTTILPRVPIDTIEWRFNEKEEALLLTSFQDDPDKANFYRYVVHRDSVEKASARDFFVNDNLTNGQRVSIGSGYNYRKNDTLIISLYHIEQKYYDFLTSTSDAKNANGNPFAQPSRIKSTVEGGIGIFTNLVYDRKMVIIK